ncbi:MAG: TlpA disulfide reductase family protein [Dokdonella sp.]
MFNRTNLLIVLIALGGAFAGFYAGGWLRPVTPPAPGEHGLKIGDPGIALNLPDVAGKPRSLTEWQGKLVLLNFWASWCGPCREEMPLLDRSQKRHADKGLQIVGIAADTPTATQEFLRKYPVEYPILVDDPQRGDDASMDYGNTRSVLPYTVLIGRDGRVLAQRFGNFSEAGLERWLAPYL